jgi:hypothetical protein
MPRDSDFNRASITGKPIRSNIPPPDQIWDSQRRFLPLALTVIFLPISILLILLLLGYR